MRPARVPRTCRISVPGGAILLVALTASCGPPHGSSTGAAVSADTAEGDDGGQRLEADAATARPAADLDTGTHVVLLGTGTPNAEPERAGPATAILVDGRAYLADAGPGVVRRAAASAVRYGADALLPQNLDIAFLTHLHSDHTVGLPDLIHTPWVLEREGPLRLFGPDGTAEMARHLTAAWGADIDNRTAGRQPFTEGGWEVEATDVDEGLVYEDDRVRVTAFRVPHTGLDEAFAYRFETADRVIVVSGDTAPSEAIVTACDRCDVLVHEVYSATAFATRPPEWRAYHAQAHTSSVELAELASRARPGILVLTHQLLWGASPEDVLAEIRSAGYDGPLAYGRDLEVY